MNWIIYSIIANISIFGLEYIYRSSMFHGFWSSIHYLIIPIFIAQFALFHSFRDAPSIFLAGAVFTLTNAFLRTFNSYLLGEAPGFYGYAGIAVLITGTVLLTMDKV